MDLRRGEEDMDATAFAGRLDRFAGGIDVLRHATGEAANDRAFDLLRDGLDGGEIAVADDRKTRLDHIDLEPRQLPCHFKFLAQVHGCAGALLTIAERGVEY